jgi:tripartite-type tricarboxylate transporter receptor subunit TctC
MALHPLFRRPCGRRAAAGLLAVAAASFVGALSAPSAQAQAASPAAWPTRTVRLLVGFPAGSTPDVSARILAEPLSKRLGQPVVVENRPGASGNIAADQVAKAGDDHTLGVVINGNLTSAKQLNPKLPYDPARDFSLISLLTTAPLVLVTQTGEPSGAAFFQAARAAGDKWSYGSVGVGSVGHLGVEYLKLRAGNFAAVHVPYNGNPAAITALIQGQIQMALIPPGLALPQVKAGKLKAIGLTGGRSTLAPELASLREAGIDDFNLEVWTALIGPATLSRAAQERLAQEVPAVLRDPEVRQQMFKAGWAAQGSAPEGLRTRVWEEAAILGRIITEGHITAE